jgi:hypothetical protein
MNTVAIPIEIVNNGTAGYVNANFTESRGNKRGLLKCFSKSGTVISITWDEGDQRDIALIRNRQAESSEPLTGVLDGLGLGGREIQRPD